MRKLEYQLVKEDYKNWIHWNVLRHDHKKMKILSVVLYIGFLVLFLGRSFASAKGNPAALIPSVVLAVIVGAAMFYTTSTQNQERMIWKRSGLKKLEKTASFPVVTLDVGELGVVMEVKEENVTKEYRFSELNGILEIERLFLLEANDRTWQFVAKSAFSSREEMDEFLSYMEEKIADAKENPEKYAKQEAVKEESPSEYAGTSDRAEDGYASTGEDEADAIDPVDTSNMGKIGKMAHIMAAMAAENAGQEDADESEAESVEISAESDAEPVETSAESDAEPVETSAETEAEPVETSAEAAGMPVQAYEEASDMEEPKEV